MQGVPENRRCTLPQLSGARVALDPDCYPVAVSGGGYRLVQAASTIPNTV